MNLCLGSISINRKSEPLGILQRTKMEKTIQFVLFGDLCYNLLDYLSTRYIVNLFRVNQYTYNLFLNDSIITRRIPFRIQADPLYLKVSEYSFQGLRTFTSMKKLKENFMKNLKLKQCYIMMSKFYGSRI